MNSISHDILDSFKSRLNEHSVYDAVKTLEDLKIFMEHHVFSVWDYMSLIKYLQHEIAPTSYPWVPKGDGSVRRFVNELVMEEESDESCIHGEFVSHFELYLKAMEEIGADTSRATNFVNSVIENGLDFALANCDIPVSSVNFMEHTFNLIKANRPHEVAASLALGREHIIPLMFKSLLNKMNISKEDAPIFHYYLTRHIELDGDSHGPLSLRLLNGLCESNEKKINEAVSAANNSITCRLKFWDGVHSAIKEAHLVLK